MRYLLMGLFLLFSTVASAQSPTHLTYRLPLGQRITYQGNRYVCFDLGEIKEALSIDNDLRKADSDIIAYKKQLESYKLQEPLYLKRIQLAETEAKLSISRIEDKQKALESTTLKFVEQNRRLVRLRRAVVAVSAAAVVLAGGVYLGMQLQ